jgi:preprotein translocase subunit Sec61beta
MRVLFSPLMLIAIFCLATLAQSKVAAGSLPWYDNEGEETVNICPRVSVDAAAIVFEQDSPMVFNAKLTAGESAKVTYRWTVSAGEITEGQGTADIKVNTAGHPGEEIKATVELVGVEGCIARASASAFVKK